MTDAGWFRRAVEFSEKGDFPRSVRLLAMSGRKEINSFFFLDRNIASVLEGLTEQRSAEGVERSELNCVEYAGVANVSGTAGGLMVDGGGGL